MLQWTTLYTYNFIYMQVQLQEEISRSGISGAFIVLVDSVSSPSIEVVPIYIPICHVWECCLPTSSPAQCFIKLFDLCQSHRWKIMLLCSFKLHFSYYEWGAFFPCLWIICIISTVSNLYLLTLIFLGGWSFSSWCFQELSMY